MQKYTFPLSLQTNENTKTQTTTKKQKKWIINKRKREKKIIFADKS